MSIARWVLGGGLLLDAFHDSKHEGGKAGSNQSKSYHQGRYDKKLAQIQPHNGERNPVLSPGPLTWPPLTSIQVQTECPQ